MLPSPSSARSQHSRPRVEGEREVEILDATVDLLLEHGYERLSMDAVAKAAHASKATLYRRWATKAELVIDALHRHKGSPAPPEPPHTGSLRDDLLAAFCGHEGMVDSQAVEVLGAVLTALSTDPEFAEAFRVRIVGPKAAVTREIYAEAVARGEIHPDTDLDIVAPALAGVTLHRSFVLGHPASDEDISRVIDHLILPALTHGPHRPPRPDRDDAASHISKENR